MTSRSCLCRATLPITLLVFVLTGQCFAELAPNDLALIVNTRVPASRALADFYVNARQVPPGRIIELSLPTEEEMPFLDYDAQVNTPVLKFLHEHVLDHQVTCLVTFFGVPLRIAARPNPTPAERDEINDLRAQSVATVEKIRPLTDTAEKMAVGVQPMFKVDPRLGNNLDDLWRRTQFALEVVHRFVLTHPPQDQANQLIAQELELLRPLLGLPIELQRLVHVAGGDPTTNPATHDKMQETQAKLQELYRQAGELRAAGGDPEARAQLRKLVSENLGLIAYGQLLRSQTELFDTKDTVSSVDSELACLRWGNHRRNGWQANPLSYAERAAMAARQENARPQIPPTMMVTRLDAPTEQGVRDLILSSLRAEQNGLKGQIVCDSRGLAYPPAPGSPKGDGAYAQFDQHIRDLASFVRLKTQLKITADDGPDLIPPHGAKDVALYCGWYSPRAYSPSCDFIPGAVGIHIASYEMISLHAPGEPGWCANLLNAGCAATLGPVLEPYLQSFPNPDDFFPLLMTGKVTLAEAYWATTPMTSWMNVMIGDPLYTPYKANPAVKADDLPDRLKPVLSGG